MVLLFQFRTDVNLWKEVKKFVSKKSIKVKKLEYLFLNGMMLKYSRTNKNRNVQGY